MQKLNTSIRIFYLIVVVVLIDAGDAMASVTTFKIAAGEKTAYSPGDVVIVEVSIRHTHRVCTLEVEKTDFIFDGVKVLGATKWKEVKTGEVFTRQFKLEILPGDSANAILSAKRTCKKEGSYGVIRLPRVR